ncbi:MAG: terpene cyclase/mutase family protein [Muribaculaceae bacterium]|nr:terpene cyclase/mutase family protein [Alistipes senegalensis]MCM1474496.1 terpene cyclase/mutase family protein [Muribaculaceae bacterium]
MINLRKKLLSALLSVSLAASCTVLNMPFSVSAVSEEMTVTVSMEGLTLGQGMYFEPETYTLSEINKLVSTEGYGPFDESNLNAGMATLAFFIDNGIEYKNTGSWGDGSAIVGSSFYLESVKNIDKGYLNVPKVILEKSGMSQADFKDWGNDDEYLGEFDYNQMSGWMITVNDLLIPVGASSWTLNQAYNGYNDYGNDYVIRWQFTLNDYGADLGLQGFAGAPYYDRANKDLLYKKYAELSADGIFNNNTELKKQALSVMENLTATQEEVDTVFAFLESAGKISVNEVLEDTFSKLSQNVSEPVFGTTGGEWTVLALARGNYFNKDSDYFKGYYDRIVEKVNQTASSINQNGALHEVKSTENSRLIVALSAIGKDARNVGDWNLITPYNDNFDWIKKQGINGPIWTLIALDTQNYQTSDQTVRQQCIEYILAQEIEGGGWAMSGETADPDITAMTLQALANYADDEKVAAAVERGINKLSSIQKDNGGYASWGSINSESIAQVITACTALGIDPATDERFIKNGHSAVDALLEFYDKDSTDFTFRHTMNGNGNAMATDQAAYALVAYQRFVNGKNSLYDMTDVELDTAPAKFSGATLSLGGNIGVNFHMELDNSVVNDKNAYMQFTLLSGNTTKVMVKDSQKKNENGRTYYVFTCEVAAKEINDDITAQMIFGDGTASEKYSYSVKEYSDSILNGNYTDETKTLVKKMLDYSKYAKAYFSGGNLTITSEINAVTADTLSDYTMKSTGTLSKGITYYGSSLLLESKTTVRHYFKVAEGTDVSEYNFSGNKGNYYYIDITDISADKLDVDCDTKIGGYTVTYSPMSYAYAVLSSENASDSLKNVVRALYLYNQAANAYKQ